MLKKNTGKKLQSFQKFDIVPYLSSLSVMRIKTKVKKSASKSKRQTTFNYICFIRLEDIFVISLKIYLVITNFYD